MKFTREQVQEFENVAHNYADNTAKHINDWHDLFYDKLCTLAADAALEAAAVECDQHGTLEGVFLANYIRAMKEKP